MSFHFRLEKVLQHRQRRVDACGRQVAEAEQAMAAADAQVTAARTEIARHDQNTTAAGAAGPVAIALARAASWREHLVGLQRQAEAERDRLGGALADARTALQDAWREREVLTRLRDRQHQEWRHEQARRQQKELDEVGSIRAAIAAAAEHHPRAVPRDADGKRAS